MTVAANKDMLDVFLTAVNNNDDIKIKEMLYNGNIARVPDGTKVDIVEDEIAVKKVRILEGKLTGVEAYTITECILMK